MGLTSFFLFLDERNNRVRVTNCQPPLSPTQFLDLCRSDSLATARQAMEGQISIFRARDLKSWRRAPSVRKTFEKLVTDFLFSVPCYPAKYVFIVIFIWHFIVSLIMLFLACNFFSAEKNRVENFNPCVLFQSNKPVFFCFHRRNCYDLSAVSRRSLWNTARSRPSGICNISCQFEVYFQAKRLYFKNNL